MLAVLLAIVSGATLEVEAPGFAQPWSNAPARFDITQYGPEATARVFDPTSGQEIPAKVQQQLDKRYVYWIRTDDGSRPCAYTIETESVPAQTPVFVGAGDMLSYGRPGVVADLGIGLWATAMPIDWDGDGNWDLLYSCQDKPQRGIYLYLQESQNVFRKVKRFTDGVSYCALADMNGDGEEDLLGGEHWWESVRDPDGWTRHDGPFKEPEGRIRAFLSRQVDWDGDGLLDLIKAAGDWEDYGWDMGFDETGDWTRGPLHGYLWFHKNTGTNEHPVYAEGIRLEADDSPIDVYGNPCPCIADWDGDGDLDLVCGEFRDEFTYFENVGTRTNPRLAPGRPAMTRNGRLKIDLCMMNPLPCDWNGDGQPDLIVGQEDGRVSIILNLGVSRGAPLFAEEFFLKEIDPPIKSGGLVTPWLDTENGNLYCGNTAGYIELFRVREGAYLEGQYLREGREPFRIQAGYNLSVQGPAEEKWGYTVPCLGDLNNDGKKEIIYNSIIGRIERLLLQRIGLVTREPLRVAWPGEPAYPEWNWWKPEPAHLVVQWRTRPNVLDWDGDGREDLIAVDHEGYLAFYRSTGDVLEPGKRV
ncbi:MAG: VCBS repeat-containing protein, partial [Candidatus Hydrogenedentota bacterium]